VQSAASHVVVGMRQHAHLAEAGNFGARDDTIIPIVDAKALEKSILQVWEISEGITLGRFRPSQDCESVTRKAS
jgi:hypothetical protein